MSAAPSEALPHKIIPLRDKNIDDPSLIRAADLLPFAWKPVAC